MDNNLYYEKKNVTTAAEVKEAYDYAVEHNFKYYRAVTGSGVYFGWIDGKHTRAGVEHEWFVNPAYEEKSVSGVFLEEPITEPLTEHVGEPINGKNEAIGEIPAELDYKALYEEKTAELEKCKSDYETVCNELSLIKTAIFTIVKEWKEADSKLKD